MEHGRYVTVKQFAELEHVSVQSVYYRLKRDLKPFLKDFNGKKHINISDYEQHIKKDFKTNLKTDLNDFNLNHGNSPSSLVNTLIKQLEVKDQQIAELQRLLDQQQQLHALKIEDKQDERETSTNTGQPLYESHATKRFMGGLRRLRSRRTDS